MRSSAAAVQRAPQLRQLRFANWAPTIHGGTNSQGMNPVDNANYARTPAWQKRMKREHEANMNVMFHEETLPEFLARKRAALDPPAYVALIAKNLAALEKVDGSAKEMLRAGILWRALVEAMGDGKYALNFTRFDFLDDPAVKEAILAFAADDVFLQPRGWCFARMLSRVATFYEQSNADLYNGYCSSLRELAVTFNDAPDKAPLLLTALAGTYLRAKKRPSAVRALKECDAAAAYYDEREEKHPDALVVNRAGALLATGDTEGCERYLAAHSVSAAGQGAVDRVLKQAGEVRRVAGCVWDGRVEGLERAEGGELVVALDFDGYVAWVVQEGFLSKFPVGDSSLWLLEAFEEWAEGAGAVVHCVIDKRKERGLWGLCEALDKLRPVAKAEGLITTAQPGLVVGGPVKLRGTAVVTSPLCRAAKEAGVVLGGYQAFYDLTAPHIHLPTHGHEKDPLAIDEPEPEPYRASSTGDGLHNYQAFNAKPPAEREASREYQKKRKARKFARMTLIEKRESLEERVTQTYERLAQNKFGAL